jgi:hypothetical protein
MDDDVLSMSREDLLSEVLRLRAGIRRHRDSEMHELCWHHPELWGLLPEKSDPMPVVPEWPQFLRGCVRYRESLDREVPHAARSSVEFEAWLSTRGLALRGAAEEPGRTGEEGDEESVQE